MGITELFAVNVFNDEVMKARLSAPVYDALRQTVEGNAPLGADTAEAVAKAMKDWAIEKGATHFSHWFQPMTGITAEKHDSFISVQDGKMILDFSGKELIKGEPDASSLPSGGIRATFEARGYTAWDPSSYAFIKDHTLCIPTAFCSYDGSALDKKTPLLRSMEALNKQCIRILRLFGDTDVQRVVPTVGAEQEYFLIDRKLFEKREDLVITGRTLFGAPSPKGQELNDHYFGTIKTRVAEFMKELDEELWKMGVYAKTEHNETAPSQHELAPVFASANISSDHNQLTMEVMKKVAEKHGLVCLLHEKPFRSVNGSGKHNNWSLTTDRGENLLKPGHTPEENARFIVFLTAVIKAVDEYQDLLRLSVASAGNDHRLGSHEAPPAIMSMFIGDDLMEIIDAIEKGTKVTLPHRKMMHLGAEVLPDIRVDRTDRNRTSPFAFTGNKFEFRSPGSEFSISEPNIILNTIVAESLSGFADVLEKADDFDECLNRLMAETVRKHKRIIFGGNSYSEEWKEEAKTRGLLNLPSADAAIPLFASPKNLKLFEKHGVMSEAEIRSRVGIMLENYCKTIHIEAMTMSDMVRTQICPAISGYTAELLKLYQMKADVLPEAASETEKELIVRLSALTEELYLQTDELNRTVRDAETFGDFEPKAHFYHDRILKEMDEIRALADEAETYVAKEKWPFPTYASLLFSV